MTRDEVKRLIGGSEEDQMRVARAALPLMYYYD